MTRCRESQIAPCLMKNGGTASEINVISVISVISAHTLI